MSKGEAVEMLKQYLRLVICCLEDGNIRRGRQYASSAVDVARKMRLGGWLLLAKAANDALQKMSEED